MIQIPKYGSAIGSYNSLFYLNLTNFKMSENIYIQVQFNITREINEICLNNEQTDYFEQSYQHSHFDCNNLFKKINNNSYTFYFKFTKKNKYIYLIPDIYYVINVTLKNAKTDESPNEEKNEDKGYTIIVLVITLITAILIIIFCFGVYAIRQCKRIDSDYIETPK